MTSFFLGISFIINIFFISITFFIFKNKKSRDFFKKELEDEKAFKDFFNNKHIDF